MLRNYYMHGCHFYFGMHVGFVDQQIEALLIGEIYARFLLYFCVAIRYLFLMMISPVLNLTIISKLHKLNKDTAKQSKTNLLVYLA